MPDPNLVLSKLKEIETESQTLGWWQSQPIEPEQYDFRAAFAMDTMAFSQWLQFIFLPHAKYAATQADFPASSQVATQAVREFDGVAEAAHLIKLLSEFDALFS